MPEMRVRLRARARRALYCKRTIKWSELRGKTRFEGCSTRWRGNRGCLRSRLAKEEDAGTVMMDCSMMLQHSTVVSDLTGSTFAVDFRACFVKALRLPAEASICAHPRDLTWR